MYNMYIVNTFHNVYHIVQSFFERGNKSATLAALGGMPWSGPPVVTALEGLVSKIKIKIISPSSNIRYC